jgi:hypothetical protein
MAATIQRVGPDRCFKVRLQRYFLDLKGWADLSRRGESPYE